MRGANLKGWSVNMLLGFAADHGARLNCCNAYVLRLNVLLC